MSSAPTEISTAVGVSVSESPDMQALGLSDGHLRDAMAEIALQVLASGTSLAYGGDLRQHGFAELLAELVGRYRDHPRHGGTIVVTDFLAWPVHIRMTPRGFDGDHRVLGRKPPSGVTYDGFQSPAAGPASGRVSPESHDAMETIKAWS